MKKTALVTGCTSGIGKEISILLAKSGYNIIGTYNMNNNVKFLKNKIESYGLSFESYKLDISNEQEIIELCSKINNIDILINNAALSLDNEFDLKTKDEFMRVLEVNLVGPFLLIKNLKNKINDVIINISSTDGINTYSKYNMDYSASKAGLINLTKSLALELENNRVYAFCPNWVNTDTIKNMNQDYLKEEMKRIGQKELIEPIEVAQEIINLIESNTKSGSIVIME